MFYILQAHGERTYKYAWKDKAFLGFQKSLCMECGRMIASMEYNGPHCLLVEGGAKYPDYLVFCGAGELLFVVLECAANIFQSNNLSGIENFTPIQVAKEENGALLPLPEDAPNYVSVQITGKIDLDYTKMYLKKKKVCKTCGGFEWNRQRMYPLYLDNSTWDGSDICRIESIPGHIIFSKTAVELIKKHKLNSFCFKPL